MIHHLYYQNSKKILGSLQNFLMCSLGQRNSIQNCSVATNAHANAKSQYHIEDTYPGKSSLSSITFLPI